MLLYFVGAPEAALMIEQVGFEGDEFVRVEEHPPDADDNRLIAVHVTVPDGVDLYEHGLLSGRTHKGSEWLLSPRFLNQFPRARLRC